MPEWEDYYQILGVSPEANDEEIKRAYLDKCFILHPDRMRGAPASAQHKAEEELKRVNRATDVLRDPVKRRDYHEEWLRRQRKSPDEPPRQPPPPPPSPADIVLSEFSISPQQIQLGSSVTISVAATNNGGAAGSKTIHMTGDFVNSRTVKLSPGASTIIQFTINPDAAGEFNITIKPFAGSFRVTAQPPRPPPTASQQPLRKKQSPTVVLPRVTPMWGKLFLGAILLAIVVVLAVQFWPSKVTPGLELEYRADLSQVGNESAADAMQGVMDIITKRVDAYGVSEAVIQKQGYDRIYIRLPGIRDVDTAVELIGQTAQLDFRELTYGSTGNPVQDENGNFIWKPAMAVDSNGKEVHLTGTYLKRNTQVVLDPKLNEPMVSFEFNSEGADLFAQITGRLYPDKPLGIFLDNNYISSPIVKSKIEGGKGVIENIELEDARNLAVLLNAGALPVPIRLVSSRSLE